MEDKNISVAEQIARKLESMDDGVWANTCGSTVRRMGKELEARAAATSGDAPTDLQPLKALAQRIREANCRPMEVSTLAATAIESLIARIERAAAPATASGDLPDALRRLSERLKWMLDADQFRNVEAMLSAISATAAPATIIPDALYESVKGMQDAAYTFGDNCQEAVRVALDGVLDVMREFDAGVVHPDDAAVDRFAAAMKEKMAKSRAKGRGGWEDPAQCSVEALQSMLLGHLDKGDPVDVGNFAMMLWSRGASVSAATKPTAEQIADAIEHLIGNHVMDWHAGPTGDPEEDAFHSDDHERAVLVDAVNKALAAKRAATKPAPIDMSELRKLAWTRTGMDENSASTEYFYRAADVQSLLATRPAAQNVPEDWSDTLNEVADLLMERNWRGDLAETLRDFAKCAAPAATPAAQDQAEQSHVMPPCAAPAGQQDAAIRLLLGALARCRFDESAEGRARIANEALEALAELYKSAASRCRAQGGITQADSAEVAHPAASADAVVEAANAAFDKAADLVEGCDKRASLRGIAVAIRQLKSSSGVLRTGEGAGNAN